MAKSKSSGGKNWVTIFIIFALLFVLAVVFSSALSLIIGTDGLSTGNVARIKISGPIMVDSGSSYFGDSAISSDEIIRQIDEAEKTPGIKAFVFDINSPGGSGVASYEIADRIKQINVTTVAVIRDVGASGAYWVATATDTIYANPLSITGSIGVIGSYLDFSSLLTRYNVSYERLVAGEFKDTGTPFRELTERERELLGTKLDIIHEEFMKHVAENRGLDLDDVRVLADGSFYMGLEAVELGLVDELGTMQDVKSYLEKELGEEVIMAEYESEPSLMDLLGSLSTQNKISIIDNSQMTGTGFLS